MRVLIATHLPWESSGAGRLAWQWLGALRAAGHEVRLLVVDSHRAEDDAAQGIHRIVCHPTAPEADLAMPCPSFRSGASGEQVFAELPPERIEAYLDCLRQHLDQQVEEFNPQIVHCLHAWLFAYLALESGVPYVVSVFGPELLTLADNPRYIAWSGQAAENAGRLLVNAQWLAEELPRHFPGLKSEIVHLPPALDEQELRAAQEAPLLDEADAPPVIAFAGMLGPGCGVETLLNAASLYEQHDPRVQTVIAGDGPLRDALQQQAQVLGLQSVRWLGHIPRQEVLGVFQKATVAVLPGNGLESGLAVLEALAAGTPVIVSSAGTAAELVTEQVGAAIAPRDSERLAETILTALSEDWKQTRGPAGPDHVRQHYTLEHSAGRLAEIYAAVLEERFG